MNVGRLRSSAGAVLVGVLAITLGGSLGGPLVTVLGLAAVGLGGSVLAAVLRNRRVSLRRSFLAEVVADGAALLTFLPALQEPALWKEARWLWWILVIGVPLAFPFVAGRLLEAWRSIKRFEALRRAGWEEDWGEALDRFTDEPTLESAQDLGEVFRGYHPEDQAAMREQWGGTSIRFPHVMVCLKCGHASSGPEEIKLGRCVNCEREQR